MASKLFLCAAVLALIAPTFAWPALSALNSVGPDADEILGFLDERNFLDTSRHLVSKFILTQNPLTIFIPMESLYTYASAGRGANTDNGYQMRQRILARHFLPIRLNKAQLAARSQIDTFEQLTFTGTKPVVVSSNTDGDVLVGGSKIVAELSSDTDTISIILIERVIRQDEPDIQSPSINLTNAVLSQSNSANPEGDITINNTFDMSFNPFDPDAADIAILLNSEMAGSIVEPL
eukprot:m.30346 g.30346  ORF g.30346 m.30346 type:complete len:235 (-) comp12239_c0_seq1:42-746(-)